MASEQHVDPKVLLEISKEFSLEYDCRQLAMYLGMKSDLVDRFQTMKIYDPRLIALKILAEWNKEGTSDQLYTILYRQYSFRHIAQRFEGQLRTPGTMGGQTLDFVYIWRVYAATSVTGAITSLYA